MTSGDFETERVRRSTGSSGTSSDDDVELLDLSRSVKKRLVREKDVRGELDVLKLGTSEPAREEHDEEHDKDRHDRSESVGTMNISKDVAIQDQPSTTAALPPSTKKRKGVHSREGATLKSLEHLFSGIELNADYYDAIKKTESRCEVGEDVRDMDRQAFVSALIEVERLIRESAPVGSSVISLVALSLDMIQYLVDMGAVTSSTATTGLELEHSLSKSTSQTVNKSEVIESPWNAKKHPRRSTSHQEGDGEGEGKGGSVGEGLGRGPSRQPSLVSNDPPKRQRKYEMEEVSSKPLEFGIATAQTAEAVETAEAAEATKDNVVADAADGMENEVGGLGMAENEVLGHVAERLMANDDKQNRSRSISRSQSHTQMSSKRHSAFDIMGVHEGESKEGAKDDQSGREHVVEADKDNVGVEGDDRDDCDQNQGDDDAFEKPTWKSSLVCADISLNEVGSKIYGPLLASLGTAGLLGEVKPDPKVGGDGGETLEALETFGSLMQTYGVTTEESRELGNAIFTAVEDVYVGTYDMRNVNIAQKALAIVAEAFSKVLREEAVTQNTDEPSVDE